MFRPGTESWFAVAAASCSMTMSPEVARWNRPFPIAITLNGTMPASTRRPGNFSRSTATLPTPFCRLTMTASDGACWARRSAISAVSVLLTVTSTTPASPKIDGVFGQRRLVRRDPPGRGLQNLSAAARWLRFPAITRGRASNATLRPAAAACRRQSSRCCRRPPRRSFPLRIIPRHCSPLTLNGFDGRLCLDACRRAAAARGRAAPRLVSVMARRYVPAGQATSGGEPWVYSTYSTGCRRARAARAPRARKAASGMSPMTMAILGLLAYRAVKHLSGSQPGAARRRRHRPHARESPPLSGDGGGLGGLLGRADWAACWPAAPPAA